MNFLSIILSQNVVGIANTDSYYTELLCYYSTSHCAILPKYFCSGQKFDNLVIIVFVSSVTYAASSVAKKFAIIAEQNMSKDHRKRKLIKCHAE